MTESSFVGRSVASEYVVRMLEENMRKGKVVCIPSAGIILVPKYLANPETATPPTEEAVIEALSLCLRAQRRKLDETEDPEEQRKIERVIFSLNADLEDPSKYF